MEDMSQPRKGLPALAYIIDVRQPSRANLLSAACVAAGGLGTPSHIENEFPSIMQ